MNNVVWMFFSFKGRIRRLDFWMYSLILVLIMIVLDFLVINRAAANSVVYSNVVGLVTLWPALAIQAKRWHDRDKSAWWILINFVPVIGVIWAFVENGFLVGTEGPNRFGPPYEEESDSGLESGADA